MPPSKYNVPLFDKSPTRFVPVVYNVPAFVTVAVNAALLSNVTPLAISTRFWVIALFAVFVPVPCKYKVPLVVPPLLINPNVWSAPFTYKLPLLVIVPAFVKVVFTVAVVLFVKIAVDATSIIPWVIVPLFVKSASKSKVPNPLIVPALDVEPVKFKVPEFAISPEFVKVSVTVVFPLVVKVFPFAIVNVPWVISLAVVKLSWIFVVPVPVIALVRAFVPLKFKMPVLLTAFVIFKLPAEIFTVPVLIVIAFWVTVLLKFTVPV